MKTKISALFLIQFFVFQLFAQDIDVKKGIVTVDKNEIFKIEKADKIFHKITSLDDSINFFITQENKEFLSENGDDYISIFTFSPSLNGEKYLISYDTKDLKFSFNAEKHYARVVYLKTGFVTNNKLDQEKINTFFKTPKPSISEIKEAEDKYKNIHDKFLSEKYSIVGKKILKEGVEIGSYTIKTETVGTYKYITYFILDLNNNTLLEYNKGYGKGKLLNGKEFKFNLSRSRSETDEILLLLEKYLSFGFNVKDDAENIKKKLFNGINFEKGYVIDENNNKIEGELFIEWEAKESGIADLNKAGSVLLVRHIGDNGKGRVDSYYAKKNILFCLENGECYKGFRVNILSGFVFYKEFKKGEKISLYKKGNPKESGFVLCKTNESDGFSIYNDQKSQIKLTEYLKDCPNFQVTSYDLNNEESVMKMVDDYNNCVK